MARYGYGVSFTTAGRPSQCCGCGGRQVGLRQRSRLLTVAWLVSQYRACQVASPSWTDRQSEIWRSDPALTPLVPGPRHHVPHVTSGRARGSVDSRCATSAHRYFTLHVYIVFFCCYCIASRSTSCCRGCYTCKEQAYLFLTSTYPRHVPYSAFTLATCCHTCRHTSRSTCCSPCISMEPFTLATCCSTCAPTCCRVLSHWRHVRRQVCVQRRPLANGTDVRSKMRRQQVGTHVASGKGLGNKLSDLCPSPFTLATCAPTCVATCVATCGQCESTIRKHMKCSRLSIVKHELR